ncbi:MAG: ABC transporter permease [Prevotella sp.]
MRIELLSEIWATARRNKLRTALTGFSVAWGIFMIIFLLGAGNGLINAQIEQSNRFLASSMMVFAGQTSKPYKGMKEGRAIKLLDRDVMMTEKTFANYAEDVGGTLSQSGVNMSHGDKYVSMQTLGGRTPTDQKINKREILTGRFVNDIDIKERRKVIVLTETQAKELANDYVSLVGKRVRVDQLSFLVIGILKDDKMEQNNTAVIPYSTLKTIYAKGDDAGDIQFVLKNMTSEEQSEQFEKDYRAKLNTQHDAAPDDESAVFIWNRYLDNIQMAKGIGIIQNALWIIGLFTLLSGIVGVSNIMLITVKERTREFGIRKAIGARPWNILRLILTESIITTAIFGYTGMLCGVLANEYMDMTIGHKTVDTGLFQATMFLNPTVGLDVCLQATMVIIIAGTMAGLIPALKAARVRPIEALHAD